MKKDSVLSHILIFIVTLIIAWFIHPFIPDLGTAEYGLMTVVVSLILWTLYGVRNIVYYRIESGRYDFWKLFD